MDNTQIHSQLCVLGLILRSQWAVAILLHFEKGIPLKITAPDTLLVDRLGNKDDSDVAVMQGVAC
jgi:hypothetical protein